MNFEEMTDFELNLMASKVLFCNQVSEFLPQQKKRGVGGLFGCMSDSCYFIDSDGFSAAFNFRDSKDMMEMIESGDITIMSYRDNHWFAAVIDEGSPTLDGQLRYQSGPQKLASRAVVLTFLLKNEEYLKRILSRESRKSKWNFGR